MCAHAFVPQVFREYYDAKTTHRRLQWTYSLGQTAVKGTFGKKVFELQLTTIQAIVLLAFNKDKACPGGVAGAPISFVALQEALAMPEDVLKRAIHSFACGKFKILKRVGGTDAKPSAGGETSKVTAFAEGEDGKEGKAEKSQKGVQVTDIYAFNEQFT